MIPEELEKLIIRHKSEGHLPFFVNCTTGTTVYGAFDPINPIADICERHHIWLHIDVSSIVLVLRSKLHPLEVQGCPSLRTFVISHEASIIPDTISWTILRRHGEVDF